MSARGDRSTLTPQERDKVSNRTLSPPSIPVVTLSSGPEPVEHPPLPNMATDRRPALRHSKGYSADFIPINNDDTTVLLQPEPSYHTPMMGLPPRTNMAMPSYEPIPQPPGFLPVNPGLLPGEWTYPHSASTSASTSSTFLTPPDDTATYFPMGPLQPEAVPDRSTDDLYVSGMPAAKLPSNHFLGGVLPSYIEPPGLERTPIEWVQFPSRLPAQRTSGTDLTTNFRTQMGPLPGIPTRAEGDKVMPSERLRNRMVERRNQASLLPFVKVDGPREVPLSTNFGVELNLQEQYASRYIGLPQDSSLDDDPQGAKLAQRTSRALVIPYPSVITKERDEQVVQGRWERDRDGRIRPIVIESRINSIAVLPHPAVPHNLFPPAFTELFGLSPRSQGNMALPLMTHQPRGEVAIVKEIDPLSIYFPVDRDRIIVSARSFHLLR